MITDFNQADIPKIKFGAGKIADLPGILTKRKDKNVLIIIGKFSFQSTIQYQTLLESIELASISYEIERIETEPSPQIVDSICNKYRQKSIDAVVAIGGGSVLDGGKAISAMLKKEDSIKNYLEGVGTKQHDGDKVPFIAVPTTSGTGSETTKNAVISDVSENGYKKSLRHDSFMPDLAIIDPELSINTSAFQTAACGLDALSQLIESYTSSKATVFTDSIALPAIEMIFKSLPLVFEEGNNINARTAMSYAAMISGITLTNAGVGLVHGFASSIGGYFAVPHGIVCGTLIAIANKMNINKLSNEGKNLEIFRKYVKIGQLLAKSTTETDTYYCDLLINTLEGWLEKYKIPLLSEYGISEINTDKIIAATGQKNNPVNFSKKELKQVLMNRIL